MWLLSPLGKLHGPSFEQIWIPFTQENFVPSRVEMNQAVLEERMFKSYTNVYFYDVAIIYPEKNEKLRHLT